MLRAVFMGTPEFAVGCLERLRACSEVVAVYTQPDRPVGRGQELRAPPVKKRALELGLPVFQPEKLSQAGEYERLAALRPDVILVVAYGQILRGNVLDLPRFGCINVHASLLPRWRGAAPIQWSVLAGDPESGVCTMRLVPALDAGEVLLETRTPIGARETSGELHDRLALLGAALVEPTLQALESGSLKGRPQDESRVTYAKKLTKEMGRLDPRAETAVELDRRIRAFTPWPGTSVVLESGETLRVVKARPTSATEAGSLRVEPGVIELRAGMVVLGARDGTSLELERLQWEGRKPLSAAEFINGLASQRRERLVVASASTGSPPPVAAN